MRPDDPHGWTRERMIAATLGLLDDGALGRYREHLVSCDECRRRAEAFTCEPAQPAGADGHVPPAMLVAWSRHHPAIGAFEHRAIEDHLATCDACRDELAWLERQPVPIARTGRPMPGVGRGRWVAAWAVTATAAAAVFTVVMFQVRPAPRTPAMATPGARAELALIGTPEVLRTPMRGAAEGAGNIVRPGPNGELVLGFEPLEQAGDVPVSLVVLGPDGGHVATVECRQRDLETHHTLVLKPRAGRFSAGRYTLAVVARPHGAAAETLALDFEVPRVP